jgi:hypothetical protein
MSAIPMNNAARIEEKPMLFSVIFRSKSDENWPPQSSPQPY